MEKRDQYLLIILILLIIAIAFILWKGGYFPQNANVSEENFQQIEINFDFFKNNSLDNLEPFEGASVFEGTLSPRNPFLPQ